MAKFLTTVATSFYIEEIILNAKTSLTLVTPYLKLSKNLIERIMDADNRGIVITLIYGKNKLHANEQRKLDVLNNLELYFCENLHAKCYHNEDSMIITSMNLYEFSEKNNREMGIFVEKDIDLKIFEDSLREIDSIKNASIIEKTKESSSSNSREVIFQKHLGFEEQWNFYLPNLYKVLKNRLPGHQVILDKILKIKGYPVEGVEIEVSGKINFLFDNTKFYKSIKSNKRSKINELLPNNRVYWNYKKINIYDLRNAPETEINNDGVKVEMNKALNVIKVVSEQLIEQ
ncbi:phospholipase D family protein [Psychroflexus sp. MES1-P1E]|uniref:phospholipase D family protein n=1 Tax=Psychroflexus sp. MES1-P1E TaxID=2058320 RepID=UPI000C79E628|nr:phospholipase D family protein [Psychroflexus sp. MES1-P1E]PKG42785.1 hypothetical protein CXF67_08475 [Psychroflexus sp. MES1-P1E]